MKEIEFEYKVKKMGFKKVYYLSNFKKYSESQYYINYDRMEMYACFEDETKKFRIIYLDSERSLIKELGIFENKEDALDNLYEIMEGCEFCYQKKTILTNLEFFRDEINFYLISNYNMDLVQATKEIEYLSQCEDILFEFKYYIENGKFVPESKAYEVCDYTVEKLFKSSNLTHLDSFKYLIYLKTNPEEAVENLIRKKILK